MTNRGILDEKLGSLILRILLKKNAIKNTMRSSCSQLCMLPRGWNWRLNDRLEQMGFTEYMQGGRRSVLPDPLLQKLAITQSFIF
jgi:hypothetical protein